MKKLRHHYIPQFYFRQFSNDDKSISLVNIEKILSVQYASISKQCYRPKFYGDTNTVEDAFSILECDVADILHRICQGVDLLNLEKKDHINLLMFIASQCLRTRAYAEGVARSISLMEKDLSIGVPKIEELENKERRDLIVGLSLSHVPSTYYNISDLEKRVLRIKCDYTFITSDNPIIKYNQWCEGENNLGVTGLLNRGLQLFFPISPKYMLLFFDSNIYDTIGTNNSTIEIHDRNDVYKLNKFQAIFADKNLYFSDWENRDSVVRLINRASMFRKQLEWKLHILKSDEIDKISATKSEIRHVYSVMPDVKLDLSFLHIKKLQQKIPLLERVQTYRHKGFLMPENKTPDHVRRRINGKAFKIHAIDRMSDESDDIIR